MYELVINLAIIALLPTLASGSSSQSQQTHVYDVVKLEIVSGDRIIGKPEVTLEPGSSAVATAVSQNGYSIRLETRRLSTPLGRLISLEYYSPYQDKWSLAGKPNIETNLGQDNLVSFKAADGRDLKIKVRVEKVGPDISTKSFGNNRCSTAKLMRWKRDMARPVSYVIRRVSLLQYGGPCCTICNNYSCCSSGTTCCSDPFLCPGKSCCNHPGG